MKEESIFNMGSKNYNKKSDTEQGNGDSQKQGFLSSKRKELLIFLTFLASIFMAEQFFREPLFTWSVNFLKVYHKNKTANTFVIILCEILADTGNFPGYGLTVFLSYIFLNIFRTAFLIFNLLFCTCAVGILKMLYANPRPYFESDEILSVSAEGGWGNPSGHSFTAVCFILSFWKIFFQIQSLKEKENLKKASFFLAVGIIFAILFSRLLIGAHSLNQIIFGGLLGFAAFYFYFYVLEIDTENPEQFLEFVKLEENNFKKIYVILLTNFFLICISLVFYFLHKDTVHELAYLARLNKKFIDAPLTPYKVLQNEGLYGFATSLGNICIFLGVFFELHYTFENNAKNFITYNFDYMENSFEFQQGKINNLKWNKINVAKRRKKTLIFIALLSMLYFPFMLLGSLFDNVFMVLFFKIILPVNLILLGMFFFFKDVFRFFKTINDHNELKNNTIVIDEVTTGEYKRFV